MAANHMHDGPHTKYTTSNKTLISIVVDRSGSMESMNGETAGALSSFIKDQSNGNTFVTASRFDNTCERFIDLKPSTEVTISNEDVEPRGMTSLYEAIGTSVNYTVSISQDFDKVIFVILTDGHENSSKNEYKGESGRMLIKEMISGKEKSAGWSFFFLGANIDSQTVGDSLGMRGGRCINFSASSEGCSRAYRACSQVVSRFRDGDVEAEFNEVERTDSMISNSGGSPMRSDTWTSPIRSNSGGSPIRSNSGGSPIRSNSGGLPMRSNSGGSPMNKGGYNLRNLSGN